MKEEFLKLLKSTNRENIDELIDFINNNNGNEIEIIYKSGEKEKSCKIDVK